MKKLLKTPAQRIVAVLVLLALLGLAAFLYFYPRYLVPVLVAVLVVGVLWIAIELFLRAKKRRRQRKFDDGVAAREGIEDRKREWGGWVDELEKQGIDRYDLPFYLLVGEPQSGKSVLLQNSDLHFPFGQTRLSGVGGTRGCDWWFTEEAVILDLAGRLFTHEGGAADAIEWAAFLDMLVDFRPMCPANGVLLVVPCDGLLQDQREAAAHKASKIQNALLTLTNKLQAQLPVYLVLTKGDKVFGFAESVHRLDAPKRHEMFGWSRSAEKSDTPFDLDETRAGFDAVVQRAQLLRSEMMASARLPEAQPEVDRMYAFPEELRAVWPNLEIYLRQVFTDSGLVDRLAFRGLYLTSGLQSGVPVAKVCTALFGESGQADARTLEGLFAKQRAYFIKDLVRNRVFGERGLVRPTEKRVLRARSRATIGYGLAAVIAVVAIGAACIYLATKKPDVESSYDKDVVEAGEDALGNKESSTDCLNSLATLRDAVASPEAREATKGLDKVFTDRSGAIEKLFDAIVDTRLVPLATERASVKLLKRAKNFGDDHDEFLALVADTRLLVDGVDARDEGESARLLKLVEAEIDDGGAQMQLRAALDARRAHGNERRDDSALHKRLAEANQDLAEQVAVMWDQTLEPGKPWQPGENLGYVLAWDGAFESHTTLVKKEFERNGSVYGQAEMYSGSVDKLTSSAAKLSDGGDNKHKLRFSAANTQIEELRTARNTFLAQMQSAGLLDAPPKTWAQEDAIRAFIADKSAAGSTLIVPSKEIENLTRDVELKKACDRALLPREGWMLDQLARNVASGTQDFVNKDAGSLPSAVFVAKCVAFTDEFKKSDWSDLQKEHGGAARNDGEPFDVSMVDALIDLRDNLVVLNAKTSRKVQPWIDHIDTLLVGHLGADNPLADSPDPGAVRAALRSLTRAASTTGNAPPRYAARASELRANYFVALQNARLQAWSSRGNEPSAIASVFQELLDFRQDLASSLGGDDKLAGVTAHTNWLSDKIDPMFAGLLEAPTKSLREHWNVVKLEGPSEQKLQDIAAQLARTLSIEGIEQKFARAATLPVPDLTVGADALPASMPKTKLGLAEFLQLKEARHAPEIASDEYVRGLRAEIAKFGDDAALSKDGSATANSLAVARAEVAKAKRTAGGGTSYAESTWKLFDDSALHVIRVSYLAELKTLVIDAHASVVDAIFAATDEEMAAVKNPSLLTDAAALFNDGGVLDLLRGRYHRDDAKFPIDLRPPAGTELTTQDMWAFDQCLAELRRFLIRDKKPIDKTKLTLKIQPDTGPAGTLWDVDAGNKNPYSYFSVQVKPDPNNFETRSLNKNIKEIARDWEFSLGRSESLVLRWRNPKSLSAPDANEALIELPSAFAPLWLAWMGEFRDGHWEIQLKPKQSQLRGGLTLTFTGDIPLPPRPPDIRRK